MLRFCCIRTVIIQYLIIGLFIGTQAAQVMTWVPPYSIPQVQTRLNQDFGGYGMKDGLSMLALQFWVPNGASASLSTKYASIDSETIGWFRQWGATHGVKVLLCVFNGENGWDWPLARRSFRDNKDAFIQSLVSQVAQYNLDGVEIDLEGSGSTFEADRPAFIQFMRELSQELKRRGKILTIATFAGRWHAPNAEWWSELMPVVDAVTSMGYEEIGRNSPDWASYYAQKQKAGAFPEKLMIGMPGSMASWQGSSAIDQIDWVEQDGVTGLAIWDANLSNSAWRTAQVWQKLAQIRGDVEVNTYSITASAGVGGTITPSGNISVEAGGSQSFSLSPAEGFRVDSVIVNGTYIGTEPGYTFRAVQSDGSIRAVFAENPIDAYSISAKTVHGGITVWPEKEFYRAGETVTITAEPAVNHDFDSWSVNGEQIDQNPLEITMTKDLSIIAHYDSPEIYEQVVSTAQWNALADSYGSVVDTGSSLVRNDTAGFSFTVIPQSSDEIYPWVLMEASLEESFEHFARIAFQYRSNEQMRVALDQEMLSAEGSSYEVILPASAQWRTVSFWVGEFNQPQWVETATPLALSQVGSLSFSPVVNYESGNPNGSFAITNLRLHGIVQETDVTLTPTKSRHELAPVLKRISPSGATVTVPMTSSYTFALYNLRGSRLWYHQELLSRGEQRIPLAPQAPGIYLFTIEGSGYSKTIPVTIAPRGK